MNSLFRKWFMRFLLCLFCLITIIACSRNGSTDPALRKANAAADHQPQEAMTMLDDIDEDDLSEINKMYFVLTKIKIRDKLNLPLCTMDSIERIVEFFRDSNDNEILAEACYYAGRVATKNGDFPAAIKYFQRALGYLPDVSTNKELQGNLLSQLARRLNAMRLYDDAIPYLDRVIKMEEADHDTLNLVYDLELLGAVYLHKQNYAVAEEIFNRTSKLASSLDSNIVARQQMYLGACKININKERAKDLLVGAFRNIKDSYKGTACGYLAEAYTLLGMNDSAYYYARHLTTMKSNNNRKSGYVKLLTPPLIDNLPDDSVRNLVNEYVDLSEKFISQNAERGSIIQNDLFNYQNHEKARKRSEQTTRMVLVYVLVALCILLLLIVALMWQKVNFHNNKLKLQEINEKLQQYQFNHFVAQSQKLKNHDNAPTTILVKDSDLLVNSTDVTLEVNEDEDPIKFVTPLDGNSEDSLREEIRKVIRKIIKSGKFKPSVSPVILRSKVYSEITELEKRDKPIPGKSEMWQEIESTIQVASPTFFLKLQLLLPLNREQPTYKLIMLYKFGFSSKSASKLMCIAQSTVSYHSNLISRAFFNKKAGIRELRCIIMQL